MLWVITITMTLSTGTFVHEYKQADGLTCYQNAYEIAHLLDDAGNGGLVYEITCDDDKRI